MIEVVEKKEAFYCHCKKCGHEQVAFYFPLVMDTQGMNLMNRASKMPCQMCATAPMYVGQKPTLSNDVEGK